tara:strand:- start:48 stop:224 length:177 start_codon:yes stop_codon:yes gene_type:complete
MIYGYILVMVTILANGTVTGESIDYFEDPHECYQHVIWNEEIADLGTGFVCIEDTVKE